MRNLSNGSKSAQLSQTMGKAVPSGVCIIAGHEGGKGIEELGSARGWA